MIKSCYIHIPFCNNICSYCDFCKILYNENFIDKYLNSLELEIKSKYKNDILDTIYIGGGTPSSLNINQLERLLKIIDCLNKSNNLEYTIEGNFESTTEEKLKLYKKHGINRLSFGIESTIKKNLDFLERTLSKKQVKEIIKQAKNMGFNNINVDIIYALPNENIEDVKEDLDFIYKLNVEHISTYSLIIEDNTKLSINKIKNIDEDLDFKMYKTICTQMKDNNYIHYEISNFSKVGYESKHNLCYWNNNEYYGFGLGASSYIENKRSSNTRSITKYLKNDYTVEGEYEKLNRKSIIEYEIILNLRKSSGIDLIEFKNKYQKELKELYNYNELLNKKLLIEKNNKLYIDEEKWYISNSIIVELLRSEINE